MKVKKLFFHIGHGKTGSSAIQAMLAQNHEVLKQNGYLYPFHDNFKNALRGFISSGNINAGKDKSWLENQVTARIDSNPEFHTYIFSSESLFRNLSPLLDSDYMHNNHWRIHILLAVRNPIDMISSHHQQAVKRGGYKDNLKTFIRENKHAASALQYSARLIKNLDKYGATYSIVNYSVEKLEIASRFAEIMGISQILEDSPLGANRIVNRSLTAQELSFVASINAIYGNKKGARLSDKLVNELPELKADRLFISQEDMDLIIKNNHEALSEINQKLGKKSKLTFEYHPTVSHDLPTSLDPRQAALIRSMLERPKRKRRNHPEESPQK